jgi:hypothetical protein
MDYSNSNAFVLSNYSSLGTNDRLVVTTGGNVGIGTTNPGGKLHVYGGRVVIDNILGAQSGLQFNSAGTEVAVLYRPSGGTDIRLYNPTGGDLMSWSGDKVGIGTNSPGVKLEVVGAIRGGSFPNSTTNSGEAWFGRAADRILGTMTFQLGGSSATNTHFEIVDRAWSKVMYGLSGEAPSDSIRVTSSGNVGFGTGSPSYKLHVEGNVSGISIYASHDIAAFSDITVKKEVKRIENAIDKVKELNGYTYVRTDDETGTRRAGVIAQEVQKVLPEVVSANPDGTLNVAYSNMIALLIEGMKEQQATIERLENRIKMLEK